MTAVHNPRVTPARGGAPPPCRTARCRAAVARGCRKTRTTTSPGGRGAGPRRPLRGAGVLNGGAAEEDAAARAGRRWRGAGEPRASCPGGARARARRPPGCPVAAEAVNCWVGGSSAPPFLLGVTGWGSGPGRAAHRRGCALGPGPGGGGVLGPGPAAELPAHLFAAVDREADPF